MKLYCTGRGTAYLDFVLNFVTFLIHCYEKEAMYLFDNILFIELINFNCSILYGF